MDSKDWQRVESLFTRTADLPPDERRRLLDEVCGTNLQLRTEIESLLAHDGENDNVISAPLAHESALVLNWRPLDGDRLGAYRVIREIGRGGMGTVYLAERADDQFHKQVAIKVVKRGMDTADVLR